MNKILLLILLINAPVLLNAQLTPQQIDIDPGNDNPNPRNLFVYQNVMLFSATTDDHGSELWSSDGTEAGSQLIKDINPGIPNSNPREFIEYNGLVYFNANAQLWVTDGTSAGTNMVSDVEFENGIVFNDLLYFIGQNDDYFDQVLWVSDGTEQGTKAVLDENGDPLETFDDLIIFDDKLFFEANNTTYVIDAILDSLYVYPTFDIQFESPAVFHDTLFFNGNGLNYFIKNSRSYGVVKTNFNLGFLHANDNYMIMQQQSQPWISDGTEEGTVVLTDKDGAQINFPQDFTSINNEFYFQASDANGDNEIYVTNGTDAGTMMLDLRSGSESSNPSNITAIGNNIYASANAEGDGKELIIINASTKDITYHEINNGSANGNPDDFVDLNGTIYFSATNSSGRSLYSISPPTDPCEGVSCPGSEVCYDGVCY